MDKLEPYCTSELKAFSLPFCLENNNLTTSDLSWGHGVAKWSLLLFCQRYQDKTECMDSEPNPECVQVALLVVLPL